MPVANGASRRRQNFQKVVVACTVYMKRCTSVLDLIYLVHLWRCSTNQAKTTWIALCHAHKKCRRPLGIAIEFELSLSDRILLPDACPSSTKYGFLCKDKREDPSKEPILLESYSETESVRSNMTRLSIDVAMRLLRSSEVKKKSTTHLSKRSFSDQTLYQISSHPHFTRSHDIVVIGIGVTSVHLLLGCRRVLTVPSSVLRQGHRCCRCGDDRGYLWRLGLLHGRYRCEPGVIGCAIRGHNGCECAVIQNGRVEHGLIHIGHGRGFADHFIGRSIGRCPLNGASYLSLMLLILKMVVMVLEHFVGMGSEGRWWSHKKRTGQGGRQHRASLSQTYEVPLSPTFDWTFRIGTDNINVYGREMAQWMAQRGSTDREVPSSNPASTSRLGLGNLAVSQPSCFPLVAWKLGTESVLQLNERCT
ncbi:hypothetical protein T265_05877 [Opisthorchis viverrini]|uniref:Uncharacterized protein n=1 Tax=Opisthorchis viverrini TaxID=6198 RepID=A0A075AEQ9_OPIVI|nr:hypothetical protein T265_05877 [Opisthorchis viverrini]KER26969.1 hypothetical protein T265_05877 [Opisthorchis viverrini]